MSMPATTVRSSIGDFLTRLTVKTGRLPLPFGWPGRWVGRRYGVPMDCGLRLVIHNPSEYIQRCVVRRGVYEPTIIRVFRAVLGPDDVMFDVGGNIGHHSLVAASCGARVHTFEPLPRLFDRIQENVTFNALMSRITINNTAVGAEVGVATLNEVERVDDGSHSIIVGVAGKSHRAIEVPIITLDNYVQSGRAAVPHLIKIDVEGYEARVLDGAVGILSSAQPPFLVIETADRLADAIGESARSVLDRLFRAGFRIWRVPENSNRLERVAEHEISPALNNYFAAHPSHARYVQILQALSIDSMN